MRQLRVLADVDEMSVGRVKPGGKVDLTFKGDNEQMTMAGEGNITLDFTSKVE